MHGINCELSGRGNPSKKSWSRLHTLSGGVILPIDWSQLNIRLQRWENIEKDNFCFFVLDWSDHLGKFFTFRGCIPSPWSRTWRLQKHEKTHPSSSPSNTCYGPLCMLIEPKLCVCDTEVNVLLNTVWHYELKLIYDLFGSWEFHSYSRKSNAMHSLLSS